MEKIQSVTDQLVIIGKSVMEFSNKINVEIGSCIEYSTSLSPAEATNLGEGLLDIQRRTTELQKCAFEVVEKYMTKKPQSKVSDSIEVLREALAGSEYSEEQKLKIAASLDALETWLK